MTTYSEVEVPGRPPARLVGLPVFFWRYSRLKLDTFPFWEAVGEADLHDLARAVIADQPELGRWLDHLLRRPAGHHARLAVHRQTSDSIRSLAYVVDVLLSLVIGHHTGYKGGVGVVPSRHSSTSSDAPPGGPTLEPPPNLTITFEVSPRGMVPRQVPDGSADHYEVLVDVDPGIDVSAEVVAEHLEVARHISEAWVNRVSVCNPFVAPVLAVDSMATRSGHDYFELHVPARSFGPHAFAASAADLMGTINNHTLERFAAAVSDACADHRCSLTLVPSGHSTTFHNADTVALNAVATAVNRSLNAQTSISIMSEVRPDLLAAIPDVDVSWVWDRLDWRRSVEALLGQRAAWRLVTSQDQGCLEDRLAELGDWAVIKPRRNLPWWDRSLPTVAPVWRRSQRHLRIARRMLALSDVIMEPLNRISVDRYGRSGELRSFWLLLPALPNG